MKPKTPPLDAKPVCFPTVRDTPEVVEALAAVAHAAGITSTEALRLAIAHYLAKPFPFKHEDKKSGVWAKFRTDGATVDAFTAHAQAHGVSVAEGIRQCVRKFLSKQGRGQ